MCYGSYPGDVSGGCGVGRLCSEGLGAQEQTCWTIRIDLALKQTNAHNDAVLIHSACETDNGKKNS